MVQVNKKLLTVIEAEMSVDYFSALVDYLLVAYILFCLLPFYFASFLDENKILLLISLALFVRLLLLDNARSDRSMRL